MTLRKRLIFTIAGIALLLVLPSLFAVSQLKRLSGIASEQRSKHGQAYVAIGGLQTRLAELARLQQTYIVVPDTGKPDQIRATADSARAYVDLLGDSGYGRESSLLSAILDTMGMATDSILALMNAEYREEATAYFNEDVRPVHTRSQDAIARVGLTIDSTSADDLNIARRTSLAATTSSFVALLIGLAAAIALGAWTTRALTSPVMRLRHAMALVADGEFRVPENLPYDRSDEIGSVSRSFRAMTHRLADLDRLKAEFMSISTHELKTPINVISGYAELMQERVYGDLTVKQEEALTAIREQSRVLTQLVNQLLDVSRLEAGGLRLHIAEVVVTDLFDRVERSFEGLAQRKSIDLTVDVDPSAPSTIPADADRLGDQVLGNLLSNALKFTPEGGTIAVRVWREDEACHIEVADTGPGIAADQLPYIFDKFYQVGEQARSKGAGLGLSIAHDVIEAHGGSITVESEPDQGTTFHILLPLDPSRTGIHTAGPNFARAG